MSYKPKVSIIIPTYNAAETIAQCLYSIRKQTYENLEIILVDRFSADQTANVAKEWGASIFSLEAERAEAKNLGLSKSQGKYALFIDADMELTEDVVKECVILAESDPKIGGIIIPERSVGDNMWARIRAFERSFYAGTEIESARFLRRDLMCNNAGFDPDAVLFEDSTAPLKVEKLGYTVRARINSEILHHETHFSLVRWLKKKYYFGKTASLYKRRYKYSASKKMSIIYRFSMFLKAKDFYAKPHLAIGVLTLKSLEFCSAGLGYFVTQVKNENPSAEERGTERKIEKYD